jgi:hypothetical protein
LTISSVGIAAFAVVAAVGLERAPALLRFVLPALGLIGVWLSLRSDVIRMFM